MPFNLQKFLDEQLGYATRGYYFTGNRKDKCLAITVLEPVQAAYDIGQALAVRPDAVIPTIIKSEKHVGWILYWPTVPYQDAV